MYVEIDDRKIGDHEPVYVVGEIGINHNGDVESAKALASVASAAGCDAVKFQKRTVEVVYTKEELDKPRESPWGSTNGDQKRGLELNGAQYARISLHCRELGIPWFASCWDEHAVDFIAKYDPPCFKIASASLTDLALVAHTCSIQKPIILSTGMCSYDELDKCVKLIKDMGNPLILLHCVSTYPAREQDLNLRVIPELRRRYQVPVGYSGHEVGMSTTLAAVALGACMVERHITLDRSSYGSDQSASMEPEGIRRLVRYIRTIEAAMGDGCKRVLPDEIPIQRKLRRVPCLTS